MTRVRTKAGVAALAVVACYLVIYLTNGRSAGALLFGLAAGAMVAAISLGVVLTYKGSGVVNFASGAIAMYAAYVYMDLRTQGDLFIPPLPNPLALIEGLAHEFGAGGVKLPSWPTQVSLGGPWPFLPALIVALAASVLVGLILHVLVFRPLRGAPPLAKVVASVGLLVVLQAIVTDRFGTTSYSLAPVLPQRGVSLPEGVTVPEDQLIVVGIVIAVTVAIWALYKYTRFGIASRANAENEKSIVLLGHAPGRLAAASWIGSCVLVGLMGVLVSTVNTSVDPNTIVLLVVPALAAAVCGGFTSFGITVAAAIAISMGESLVQNWSLESWFPHLSNAPLPGIEQVVPIGVIIAVLIARGTALPTRATASSLRMPRSPQPAQAPATSLKMLAIGVVAVVLLLTTTAPWRLGITTTAISAVLALSLVVVTGLVGQISLMQLVLAGAAGFALSKFTVNHGLPFPLGPLAAIAVATAIGVVISLVSIRVRGVDLAIVTLAIAVAVENIVWNNPVLAGSSFGATVPPPRLGPANLGPNAPTAWSLVGYHGDGKIPSPWFGVFCVIVALLAAALVTNFRRSGSGRRALAVRSNERAAAGSGVSVTQVKIVAFSFGSFLAATGGVLSGYQSGSVSATTFGSFACITLLVYAYLGGIASVGGALATGIIAAGGLAAVAMTDWLHISSSYLVLIGGVALVITVVLNPEGIAGQAQRQVRRLAAVLPWLKRGADDLFEEARPDGTIA
jgi:branched-chain amino acid transport system permease protein